jgi:hypothetical protein
VGNLGTDRIEFPLNFLKQEVDLFSYRLSFPEHTRQGFHMAFQPHHFFVDIALENPIGRIGHIPVCSRRAFPVLGRYHSLL